MSKIDIDKFVAYFYKRIEATFPEGITSIPFEAFKEGLKKQGLCYKDGEIVELSNLEQNGKECKPANFAKSSKDLQELTEFEYFLKEIVNSFFQRQGEPSNTEAMTNEGAKNYAKKLLEIAYKQFNEAVDEEIQRRCDAIDAKEMGKEYFRSLPGSDYYAPERLHNRTVEHREAYKQGIEDTIKKLKGE